jgi:hypothetical protein
MSNTYNSTIHSPWSKSLQLSSVTLERPASVPHTRQQSASPHTTRLFIAPLNLILLLEIAPPNLDLSLFTVDRMTHNREIGPPLVEPAGLSESRVFIGFNINKTGFSGSDESHLSDKLEKTTTCDKLHTNDNKNKIISRVLVINCRTVSFLL